LGESPIRTRLIEQPGNTEVATRIFSHHERTLHMKKLLIASAISAAFAVPTTAWAQAKAPTLGQVLDASGISVNGYIDAAYSYANRNVEAGGFSDRVFDSQNNSFALRQFGLMVLKQPKEGFGGVVNLTVGSDAQLIHSYPEASPSTFDLTQAYGQYATGSLTLMAGKFVTLSGTEVIWSPSNTTFSRSILFGAIPFTHTGVRAAYAVGDQLTLYGGLNNGWDQLTDGNRGKTVELGATYTPIKPLTLIASVYSGKESATATGAQTGTGPQDTRNSLDFVATWSITNAMSLGGEILYVSQDRPAGGTAKYNGAAVYFTYLFTPQWRVVTRGELFDDKQNFHFAAPGVTAGSGVKYTEITVAGSYLPSNSMELRAEVRGDRANTAVFVDSNGSTGKSLQSLALQGIYKF